MPSSAGSCLIPTCYRRSLFTMDQKRNNGSIKCPACGFVYPITPREVEEVDGDLERIDGKTLKKQGRSVDREVWEARSREALEAIAVQRGYKSPSVWAEIRLAARENRKPNYAVAMSRRRIYA